MAIVVREAGTSTQTITAQAAAVQLQPPSAEDGNTYFQVVAFLRANRDHVFGGAGVVQATGLGADPYIATIDPSTVFHRDDLPYVFLKSSSGAEDVITMWRVVTDFR